MVWCFWTFQIPNLWWLEVSEETKIPCSASTDRVPRGWHEILGFGICWAGNVHFSPRWASDARSVGWSFKTKYIYTQIRLFLLNSLTPHLGNALNVKKTVFLGCLGSLSPPSAGDSGGWQKDQPEIESIILVLRLGKGIGSFPSLVRDKNNNLYPL